MDSILNCCICFVIAKYQKPRTNIGQCLKAQPRQQAVSSSDIATFNFQFCPKLDKTDMCTRETFLECKQSLLSDPKMMMVSAKYRDCVICHLTPPMSGASVKHDLTPTMYSGGKLGQCQRQANGRTFTNKIIRQFKNA